LGERLNSSEATKRIREIVRFGEIRTTAHCRRRMAERSFTFQDLVSVLLNGAILDNPEYDERCGRHRHQVRGSTIEGDSAVAVTVILGFRSLLVVTIFEGADLEPS
jgi:hypothetical protein